MTRISSSPQKTKRNRIITAVVKKNELWWLLIVPFTVLVVITCFGKRPHTGWPHYGEEKMARGDNSKEQGYDYSMVVHGRAGGHAYYHCGRNIQNAEAAELQERHLVMLHGSKFTKEDWKKSGILSQLCAYNNDPRPVRKRLTVTALDFQVRSSHKELEKVLNALASEGLVRLPVDALVTPSASGKAIVEWIGVEQKIRHQSFAIDDQVPPHRLGAFVRRWIPVASPSVLSLPKDAWKVWKLHQNQAQGAVDILALYGDKDAPGRKASEHLRVAAGATVQELPGRHPCYLDSPNSFVETVLKYMDL